MSEIVRRLRDYLHQHPSFKEEFAKAFEKAKATGIPQFEELNISTLADYLDYYESLLTWVPSENKDGTAVFNHLCLFYLVLDMLPLSEYQSRIHPSTQAPFTWLSAWIIDYAQEIGAWMNTPESISDKSLSTFYAAPSYHMQDYDRVPWKTFNEFFARHIPRPIDDVVVIVSPADATFDGWWPVDSNASCTFKGIPCGIRQLLDDSEGNLAPTFAGGRFCHSFLGPNDYHRLHAPVSGRVVEARVIPGLCYLEVAVVPDKDKDAADGGAPRLTMLRKLEPVTAGVELTDRLAAPNSAGYQFLQARGLVLIDSPDLGLVAVLPIGMAQVSSVVLTVQAGQVLAKGDELGFFQFGGSDIVMVFQAGADVQFTAEQDIHYPYGKQVALAHLSK